MLLLEHIVRIMSSFAYVKARAALVRVRFCSNLLWRRDPAEPPSPVLHAAGRALRRCDKHRDVRRPIEDAKKLSEGVI